MKLRVKTLKLRDNASDIVVVSDVKRDVMSPIKHHMQQYASYAHYIRQNSTTFPVGNFEGNQPTKSCSNNDKDIPFSNQRLNHGKSGKQVG